MPKSLLLALACVLIFFSSYTKGICQSELKTSFNSADVLKVVPLSSVVECSAYDERTSQIAMVSKGESKLVVAKVADLVNGTVTNTKSLEIPGNITCLESTIANKEIKASYFFVGATQPDAVHIVDAEAIQIVKTIPIESGTPMQIAPPRNSDTQLLLVAIGKKPERQDTAMQPNDVVGIQLSSLEIKMTKKDIRPVVMTYINDSDYFYFKQAGGSELRAQTLLDETNSARKQMRSWNPLYGFSGSDEALMSRHFYYSPKVFVDRYGGFVCIGNRMVQSDFSKNLTALDYVLLGYLDAEATFIGLRAISEDNVQIVVASSNDGKEQASFPLPKECLSKVWAPSNQKSGSYQDVFQRISYGYAIRESGHFVMILPQSLVVVQVNQLGLDKLPNLRFSKSQTYQAVIGTESRITPDVIRGTPALRLIDAPKGMVVEGNSIVWKPGADDLGSHSVSLMISEGATQRQEELIFEVDYPNIPVSFVSAGCSLSPDRSKLLVWGYEMSWAQGETARRRDHGGIPYNAIAVIDTAAQRVLGSYQTRRGFKSATISNDSVFLQLGRLPSDRMGRMEKISLNDYKLENEFDCLEGKAFIFQDLLVVNSINYQEDMSGCYKLTNLKPTKLGNPFDAKAIPIPFSDCFRIDRVVFDGQLKDRKLLLPMVNFQMSHSPFAEYSITSIISDVEGRALDTVSCIEAASNRIVKSFKFPDEKRRESPDFYCLSPESLFVTSRVGVRALPNPFSQMNKPFRIEPVQSTFVLTSPLGSEVRYVADGATRFELTYPIDLSGRNDGKSTTLVSSTGEFIMDLRKEAASLFLTEMQLEKGRGNRPLSEQDKERKKISDMEFQSLTGRKPNGIQGEMQVMVRAYNTRGASATLQHSYKLDFSDAEYARFSKAPSRYLASGKSDETNSKPQPSTTGKPEPKAMDMEKERPTPQTSTRTWTDTKGKTINGEFLRVDGEFVELKVNEKTARVPIARLSEADQAWIAKQSENNDK